MRRNNKLFALLSILFAFSLVAAACGSDDGDTDAGSDDGGSDGEAMEELSLIHI